jgi:membrane protease YdiL (CAAX protease family)
MTSFDPEDQPRAPAAPDDTENVFAGVTWGVREIAIAAVAIIVVLFLVELVIGLPADALFGEDSQGSLGGRVLAALLWDLGIVFIVYQLVRRKGGGWRQLGLRPPKPSFRAGGNVVRRLLLTMILAYFCAIAVVQFYALILNLIGLEELLPERQIPDNLFDHDWVLYSFALIGVSVVPFAEELFFRGMFFGGLRKRLSFVLAGAISGGSFSLAHADPGLILPFTGVGMVLAYVYQRTGTLWTSVGVHVLFNSVSFLILILVPEAR